MSSTEIMWRGVIIVALLVWWIYRWIRVNGQRYSGGTAGFWAAQRRSEAISEAPTHRGADDAKSTERPLSGPEIDSTTLRRIWVGNHYEWKGLNQPTKRLLHEFYER